MEQNTASKALSPLLITLYKGVLYQEQKPELWQALLQLRPRVQDHATPLGLELLVDEAEGYAYFKQREPAEDGTELPRLVQRRQLGYTVSLLLALLRKKLAEHDAAGGESRLILSRDQISDLLQVFVANSANEAKLMDRINTDINKVVELGFLRPLRGQEHQFELLRIIKTFVDAQWLGEFTERLEAYRAELKND